MATRRFLALLLVASLALAGVAADAGIDVEIAPPDAAEAEQLRSKIAALESGASDKARELKSKDEKITQLEKAVEEKSASIVSLQGEIESFQKKGAVDAEKLVGKAHSRVEQLEQQVKELTNDLEKLSGSRNALEARANELEKKLEEVSLQVEDLEKKNIEQKKVIQKTERALHVAEEELMRAHLEATSKSNELSEIHGAWLPPWLVKVIFQCQDIAVLHWNEHGKPVMDIVLQKASEKSAQVHKWAEPHLECAKTKILPVVKEQWITLATYCRPHLETLSTKTVETYHTCKSTVTPHVVKVQELADPYVQEAKKFAKPHIDQIATITKPHVEKVRVVLKPYTKHVVSAYGKFLKSARMYHDQVQAVIEQKLKEYEATRTLATKELVWFMASALLALPVFFLYRILSTVFCKKGRKPVRNAQANHTSRRPKRRHVDK